MLLNLHIKNIILIDDLDISFENKLNILTGETGAGKSIIIGSLGICLGGKFSKDILRDQDKEGVVELLFSVDSEQIRKELQEMEIPDCEEELLITRRLGSNGRCVNRINDATVTTAKLKEVAVLLMNLHAQHEQQTLLKASKHLEILDKFGAEEISALKSKVSELYKEYNDLNRKLEESMLDESEKNKQLDFLKFQLDEIEKASLKEGEDEEIEASYKLMQNSEEILSLADSVYRATGYGAACAVDQIDRAIASMKRISELDDNLTSLYEMLEDIDNMLGDYNRELSAYMDTLEFDDREFRQLEERMNLINSLKVKYGNSISEIFNARDSFAKKLEELAGYDEFISSLKEKIEINRTKLDKACDELTAARQKNAEKLCELIKQSLLELNFSSVIFEMRFEKTDSYSANGNDNAYFVISTNVGEEARPLYDVASGGELSRVMLALKSSMAYEDETPTLVFDEIDVGISGRTAQKVAEKMSLIAKKHQVICITHLPQIAAMADTHFLIEKSVVNNKTNTNIRKLDKVEEIDEIARMLGGAEITEATFASAREMKQLADSMK